VVRRSFLMVVAVALSGLGLSCVTPVIPLPPPPLYDMTFALSGPQNDAIVLSCPRQANPAYGGHDIFVYNRTEKKVVVVTAAFDGSFTTDPLPAKDGDEIEIWAFISPGDASDSLCGRADFASGKVKPGCSY
jgi:hypothetical protein